MELENGKTYLVNSTRKGTFAGRLLTHDDTWATFEITGGRAKAILSYNERDVGEEVTVRREWCGFTEQPDATPNSVLDRTLSKSPDNL